MQRLLFHHPEKLLLMKKLPILALVLLLCSGLKAQTYTSGHLTVTAIDTMWHDSTNCVTNCANYYQISIDVSFMGQTVTTIDTSTGSLVGTFVNTSGVSPWVFTTDADGGSGSGGWTGYWDYSISATGYMHMSSQTRKVIAGPDTVFATSSGDSLYITDPCEYSTVSGHAFADNNGNCIYDAGDVGLSIPLSDIQITDVLMPPGGGFTGWHTGSTSGGSFTLFKQKSWVASCTVSLPSYYYFVYGTGSCFAGPYTFTTLPATGADFPLQCTSNVDVQCDALSVGTVRLHTPFFMHPFVSNTGCDAASGQMKLVKDPRVIYDATLSAHPADAVSGDTLKWNYSGLTNLTGPGYWNSFFSRIHLTPDASVSVGDTLCFTIFSNVPTADINPSNNYRTFCIPVVYSYDPNMKEVSPEGTGPEGFIPGSSDTLTYTLHFQNTGSAAAYDIKITDTLDSHINPASLKILGTSHNMTPKWLTPNVVQFVYDNINLPDSNSNEPASHGAVKFSVKLNSGLPVGTEIRNTGYIYFDLNPAVVTNTVLNTLITPTGIDKVKADAGVRVYPNPATDHITIENLEGGELAIFNMTGTVVIRRKIADKTTTIDVSNLAPGVYVLKTSNSLSANTERFIKL
jgi:hypothetical protein